jgi:hypothetical protein
MGANARKINNARSQKIFDEATSQYEQSKNPTALEGKVGALADNPYSAQETSDIRARGTSPITAAYGRQTEDIKRQAALSGGAPNTIAALAKTGRDRSQALSTGIQNVNAGLAESTLNAKQNLLGMQGQMQGQRMGQGLQAIGAQGSAPPQQGLPWAKIASTAAQVGAGIATGGGSIAATYGAKKLLPKGSVKGITF